MLDLIFVLTLALVLASALGWGVARLHHEHWQIMATIPRAKAEDGSWRGANITWYGAITASACLLGAALFLLLTAALGVPLGHTAALLAGIALFCLPAAKFLAQYIEGVPNAFSVAAATSVGVLVAPLAMLVLNLIWHETPLPLLGTLAALSVAYVYGEALGRLACISFGCCWGKPVSALGPLERRLFGRFAMTFHGSCKKIAYVSGLEGIAVVPIQAITSVVYLVLGSAAMLSLLRGHPGVALFVGLGLSQLWRAYSETLRADDRSGRRFTPYQLLALGMAGFAALLALLLPAAPSVAVRLEEGLRTLWQPGVILTLQIAWFGVFLYTGWSGVTGSSLSFHVRRDRV